MIAEIMVSMVWGVLIVGWSKMLRDLVLSGKVREFVRDVMNKPFKEKTVTDRVLVAYFVLTIPIWLPMIMWFMWLVDIIPASIVNHREN